MNNFEQLTQLTELNAEEAMDINGGGLVSGLLYELNSVLPQAYTQALSRIVDELHNDLMKGSEVVEHDLLLVLSAIKKITL
ncbi:hypothetical protein [Chitinophaga sp. 212800010-3]|uniref:hypothetical protein n=1 Tax=unclassified Chitinophaga TaxID=2619133 RepID=UPI002DE44A0A|nr:hypothetical protein [Chitinophaga sp. 212800010-3]